MIVSSFGSAGLLGSVILVYRVCQVKDQALDLIVVVHQLLYKLVRICCEIIKVVQLGLKFGIVFH
jgi:hypothetical protein